MASQNILSFQGSAQFRDSLIAKNLTPYKIDGGFSYQGDTKPYVTTLIDLTPTDLPNLSQGVFDEAIEEMIPNTYGAAQVIDAAEVVGQNNGAVSMQQAGLGSVLFGKSELKGEYGPSFAELELLSEFFIDANAVINKFTPEGGYIDSYIATDNILPKNQPKSGGYPNFTISDPGPFNPLQGSVISLLDVSTGGAGLSEDSYLKQLSAGFLAQSFRERIEREVEKNSIGRLNLQAFSDPFSLSLLVSGKESFVAKNYAITVPDGVVDQASFLLQKFSGTYIPTSPIEGDYFSDPANEVALTTNPGFFRNLYNKVVKPATPTNPSIKFLNNTGSGQKSVLFSNINYNKYRPNYEQNTTQVGLVIDQIFDKSNSLGNFYIPSTTDDISLLSSPLNVDVIGKTYEGTEIDNLNFGLKSLAYTDDNDPTGGFTWTQSSTYSKAGKYAGPDGNQFGANPNFTSIQDKFAKSASSNFKDRLKQGSLLQRTQEIVENTPKDAKNRLTSAGNAINQVSKVFSDGYKEMTKGSRVRKYVNKNGVEVGEEYGRVFTKDVPYFSYNNLQQTVANDSGLETNGNIRKFTNSILDSTYNLNINPTVGTDSTSIKDGKVKKYMLSLENLAWVGSDEYNDLAPCEKGPNGGRIMWFPPYNLSVDGESSTARFNPTSFLGRPEPIYTYENTTRGATLKFQIIVDHSSVSDILVKRELERADSNLVNQVMASFHAGLKKYDIYELARKFNTLDMGTIDQLYQEILGSNQTTEEEKKQATPQQSDYNAISNSQTQLEEDFTNWSFLFPIKLTTPSPVDPDYETIYDEYIFNQDEYIDASFPTQPPLDIFFNSYISESFSAMERLRASISKVLEDGTEIVELTLSEVQILGSPENQDTWIPSIEKFFYDYILVNGKKISDVKTQNGEKRFLIKTDGTVLTSNALKLLDGTSEPYNCTSIPLSSEELAKLDYTFNAAACRAINIKSVLLTPVNETPPDSTDNTNSTPNQDTLFGNKVNTPGDIQTKRQGVSKRILRKLLTEQDYFEAIKSSDPFIYDGIKSKFKHFNPAFHSMTPEGLNSRLVFLNQCVRPGRTIPVKREDGSNSFESSSFNTNFGTPPILVLRIGDFYHTKIVPKDLSIGYEPIWDMNPEGIGFQPMIANISLSFEMIGGHGLTEPVARLQNALSFNYYANTEMYDERAVATEDTTVVDNALIESIRNEEPLPKINNVNSAENNAGTTFGEIINSTPSENGVQTGVLQYQKFFNSFVDIVKEYFNGVTNGYESFVKEYNLGVWAQINNTTSYKIGYFNNFESSSPGQQVTILGKQVTWQGPLDRVGELLVDLIDSDSDRLMYGIEQVNSQTLSNFSRNKIKSNYIDTINKTLLNNFNSVTTAVNNLSNTQLNMTKYMQKMDFVSFSGDGKILNDGNPKIYNLTGQTEGGENTLDTFKTDYYTVMSAVSNFHTYSLNKIIFNIQYTSGMTTTYTPMTFSNEFGDAYVYTIFSTIILDETKKETFRQDLVKNVIPDETEVALSEVDRVISNFWVPFFTNEKSAEDEFLQEFKNNPTFAEFQNFNPQSNGVSVTQKTRNMNFSTAPGPIDLTSQFKDVTSNVNYDDDPATFNGKKQFDG